MTRSKPLGGAAVLALFVLATACSPAAAEAPVTRLSAAQVMLLPAPEPQRFRARDGASLAYRVFEPAPGGAAPRTVAILLHGSAGSSRNMTLLGRALAAAGTPAFAPDARGQGLSGRHGDVDYVGQNEDDLADFLAVVRRACPDAALVLVGQSAGGGLALRTAGAPLGRAFARFVLLSPYVGRNAPSDRPSGGYAKVDVPRMALLAGLNGLGVTAFNGARVVTFSLPPDAERLGATRTWSYRMAMSYGPDGALKLAGAPAYRLDAERAPAPIALIAGAEDEVFRADGYAADFAGLERKVTVALVPGVDHMGVLSDAGAIALTVRAVTGEAPADRR